MASAAVISLGGSALTVSSAQRWPSVRSAVPSKQSPGRGAEASWPSIQNAWTGANLLRAALHFKAQLQSSEMWFAHLTDAKMA